jgi:hypothetical protein
MISGLDDFCSLPGLSLGEFGLHTEPVFGLQTQTWNP